MASNLFADFTKMFSSFGEFKSPVNTDQLMAQFRSNAETGTAVMQILTESAQAIARRQAELVRTTVEQALSASKELSKNATPDGVASKIADAAKSQLQLAVSGVQEIAELGTKSTQEAFEVLNKRVAEQFKEFSDAAQTATTATKEKAA